MTKVIRIFQNYLILGLPFVLVIMVWGSLSPEADIQSGSLVQRILWEILGWNIMTWFTVLIMFLALLVAFPEAREKT